MSSGKNDTLARGGKSFTFPSNSHIEQSKWDAIFGPREDKPKRKSPITLVSKRGSKLPPTRKSISLDLEDSQ